MPPSVGRIALRSISGRKAGEDHARSQCPEEHPGTQGPLRGERAAEGWALGRAWTRWEEQRAACRGERLFARNGSSVPVFRRDFITPTWPTSSSDSGLLRQKREEPYFERTVLRSDAARSGSWSSVPSSKMQVAETVIRYRSTVLRQE